MIEGYDKRSTKKLVWSDQARAAYNEIREKIRTCPKLFFMDRSLPIELHTDASDFGIGAFLSQVSPEGETIPIGIMSRLLSKTEMKWTVTEKELFAIVEAFNKFQYLLGDTRFTVFTDHKNLTYASDPPSPKVRRWKLAIQGYDFDVVHIPGVDNVVADGLSRILPLDKETLAVLKGKKIPQEYYDLIKKVHTTDVGHLGVEKTLERLKSLNHEWKGMREHVVLFLHNCPTCQKLNTLRVSINGHPFTLASYRPMEEWHMDTLAMGIVDDEGYSHVLVVIDSCSRWIKLFPLRELTAETAALCLYEHICTFGQPLRIRSDNGTQFANAVVNELNSMTGIEKINTCPYSSEENGIVERSNREILRHVRSTLFDKGLHREFRRVLPSVARIMNSTKSSVTGCTPAELTLMNPSNLLQGLFKGAAPVGLLEENLTEWVTNAKALYDRTLIVAQQIREKLMLEKTLSQPKTFTEFEVESYVLVRHPEKVSSVGKLKMPLKGPMLVQSFKKSEYTLLDITTNDTSRVHISRIKPFYFDESLHDPYEIAQKDRDEEVVECILRHYPEIDKSTNKSTLDFEVKWLNQDSSNNRWLPWRELSNNSLLHKYLLDKGFKRLIPYKYREKSK